MNWAFCYWNTKKVGCGWSFISDVFKNAGAIFRYEHGNLCDLRFFTLGRYHNLRLDLHSVEKMITVKWVILKGKGHGPIEVLSRYFNGVMGKHRKPSVRVNKYPRQDFGNLQKVSPQR
jgi:hypothetical protein